MNGYNNEFATVEEGQDLDLLDEERSQELNDKFSKCPMRKGFEFSLQDITDKTLVALYATMGCISACSPEAIEECGGLIIDKKLEIYKILDESE